jgi:hypothetical protein
MSIDTRFGVRFLALGALLVAAFAGCSGSAPTRPTGGGAGGTTGRTGGMTGSGGSAGGNTGGSSGLGTGGMVGTGTGGVVGTGTGGMGGGGTGGRSGSGGATGTGGTAASGGSTGTGGRAGTGGVGGGGAGGTIGTGGVPGSGGAGGTVASCAMTLFGRYLQRTDGNLLYEPDAASESTIRDAGTGFLLSGVIAVSEASTHGCAVQGTSKTAWCWRTAAAGNSSGQLGNGTTDASGPTFRATQVLVGPGQLLANVVSVATGGPDSFQPDTSCAITQDGGFSCWGTLTYLVNDTGSNPVALTSGYAVPITTDGATPLTGVLQASITGISACVVRQGSASKELWCWGENRFGQIGTGDQTPRRYPTKVVGVVDPQKVFIHGFSGGTGCVVDGGGVRCWGYNAMGQSGTGIAGTPVLAPTVVTLMGGATALAGIIDLSSGPDGNYAGNTCALTSTQTAQCWGRDFQSYPTAYGVTNVSALGTIDGRGVVRLLTSDGVYHVGNATRAPNCGLLQ